MLRITAFHLRIETDQGLFGFRYEFGPNLTIIRGGNSSGKSTLVNCLLYAFGMEELIGARGEAALPYAVKEWFVHDGAKIDVRTSEVLVEFSTAPNQTYTIRRAIKHEHRNSKLVEIALGSLLTDKIEFSTVTSTYLFDPGAAQAAEGFHRFLETVLGLQLPQVPATNGGSTKLYLQTIFAALAVEQKRGWTDYIANIPFFGIREPRTRVVEYLLGLNVFDAAEQRSGLDADSVAIGFEWDGVVKRVSSTAQTVGLSVKDIPSSVKAEFGAGSPIVRKLTPAGEVDVATYMEALRAEYEVIESRLNGGEAQRAGSNENGNFDRLLAELQRLTHLYETSSATQELHKASLVDMQELYSATREDLNKNRTAAKLRTLGAEYELSVAVGKCPTCHQDIDDSLIDSSIAGPQMDLASNILYLERQFAVFERQIAGLTEAVRASGDMKAELSRRVTLTRGQLDSARKDLAQGSQQSRVDLRREMQIETEFAQLEEAHASLAALFVDLQKLAKRLKNNQEARKQLPKLGYSVEDEQRIGLFEKNFRANASSFEYESADVSDIELNRNALLPVLTRVRSRTDIKADSSASDFVRLIWSYLLALYQSSSSPAFTGNHPRFILFDEPGQHSMAASSQHALMQLLAGEKGLQSVIAASFDESEVVFREATANVEFRLIELGEKAIQPLL